MTTSVKCGVTAGLAIVGASVLAVAPLTLPMPSEAAPVTADVHLSALSFQEAAGMLVESGVRAGSGVAVAPLSPVLAGIALAYGDEDRAYSVIRNSIDAPLWAADPAINALAGTLGAPIGGGMADNIPNQPNDGALVQFRDGVLWAGTDALRTSIRDALGASEPPAGENYSAAVGRGLLESGERFVTNTVGAPLGLVAISQAVSNGSKEQLYIAIRQYIDAPLYAADPTIDALAQALPRPLGGADGQINNFRDDVLWRATAAVRTPIADALGVDPNLDKDDWDNPALTENNLLMSRTDKAAKTAKSGEEAVTGSGKSTGTTTAGSTVNNRPISTAVQTINSQLKESAQRLDRTVKKITGTDQKNSNKTESAGESD